MLEQVGNILGNIKNIKGVRFYFLVIVLFLFSIIFLFKEEITTSFNKHIDEKELKLRHSDTSKIRHVIEKVYNKDKSMAYILYLYQPERPVIKRLEMASTSVIENEMKLNEFILSRQRFIEEGFKRSDFILLDASHPIKGTEKFHRINGVFIPYIYIYGIRGVEDDVVGEVHIWFKDKPTDEELRIMTSGLSETTWYIY